MWDRQTSSGPQRYVVLGMTQSVGEVMTFRVKVATLKLTPVVARLGSRGARSPVELVADGFLAWFSRKT